MVRRKGRIPRGRITFKKVNGGFNINIKGRRFDEVSDKGAARAAVKRIRRLRREDLILRMKKKGRFRK